MIRFLKKYRGPLYDCVLAIIAGLFAYFHHSDPMWFMAGILVGIIPGEVLHIEVRDFLSTLRERA